MDLFGRPIGSGSSQADRQRCSHGFVIRANLFPLITLNLVVITAACLGDRHGTTDKRTIL